MRVPRMRVPRMRFLCESLACGSHRLALTAPTDSRGRDVRRPRGANRPYASLSPPPPSPPPARCRGHRGGQHSSPMAQERPRGPREYDRPAAARIRFAFGPADASVYECDRSGRRAPPTATAEGTPAPGAGPMARGRRSSLEDDGAQLSASRGRTREKDRDVPAIGLSAAGRAPCAPPAALDLCARSV